MTDGWVRVDKQARGGEGYEDPTVVVVEGGDHLYLSATAYEKLGEPEYVSFFKTGSKVGIEPCEQRSGINPHKVQENRLTSFGWHECETKGSAVLTYDEKREFWTFDTEELSE